MKLFILTIIHEGLKRSSVSSFTSKEDAMKAIESFSKTIHEMNKDLPDAFKKIHSCFYTLHEYNEHGLCHKDDELTSHGFKWREF